MRLQRPLTSLLAAAVLVFSIGCGKVEKTTSDALPQTPRIISLAPAITEMLFHLGCGKYVVGRTAVCNYPADVRSLPVVGDFSKPNLENVLAQKPTHIFATSLLNPKLQPLLSKGGRKVFISPAETLDDYCRWVQFIGLELNVRSAAEKEIGRVKEWEKTCKNAPRIQEKVLFVLWDSPLIVAGENTLPNTAIRCAGAENAIRGQKGYVKCSSEVLLDKSIRYIVWAANKALDESSPLYKQLTAVQGRRFYTDFDQDELLRPSPRFTGAVDRLRENLQNANRGKQ